jgi:hypothetical protein
MYFYLMNKFIFYFHHLTITIWLILQTIATKYNYWIFQTFKEAKQWYDCLRDDLYVNYEEKYDDFDEYWDNRGNCFDCEAKIIELEFSNPDTLILLQKKLLEQ